MADLISMATHWHKFQCYSPGPNADRVIWQAKVSVMLLGGRRSRGDIPAKEDAARKSGIFRLSIL